MTAWTGPEAIIASLRKRWDSGRLLAERAQFPLELPLRQPTVAQMGEQFEQVRAWILELEAGSGAGYEIVWREINHRQLGRNRVPDRVLIRTFDAAVRMIGKQGALRQFDRLAALTLAQFPALGEWLERRALLMIECAGEWERVLACLQWFVGHPRSPMLMDAATLHAHRTLWGQEEADKRYLGELMRLSAEEKALFDSLRSDAIAPRLRLEQERISYRWLKSALQIG